jgi:hypothetical protein
MRDYWSRNPEKYRNMRDRYKIRRKDNLAKDFFQRIRSSAKRAGMDFNLDESDFQQLPKKCPVLGIELNYDGACHDPGLASVDRINNSRGYVRGNVVIVSYRANALKRDATLDEMRRLLAFYGPLLEPTEVEQDYHGDGPMLWALLLSAA